MRDHWRYQILRLCTAALAGLITWFARLPWLQEGFLVVLLTCPRAFPDKSSPGCLVVVLFYRPRREHASFCREEMFIRVHGLGEPHPAYKSCICSTLPDFTPCPSAGKHCSLEESCLRELHDPSLVRFPKTTFKRRLLVRCPSRGAFRATILRDVPATTICPWQVSPPSRDAFPARASSIESDLPLRSLQSAAQERVPSSFVPRITLSATIT